jgi:hypothetical protein
VSVASIIYVMCAATSGACAALLLRAYSVSRVNLLFWSGLCFVGLAVSNALLVIDIMFLHQIDLMLARHLLTLASLSLLIYSLVWETR